MYARNTVRYEDLYESGRPCVQAGSVKHKRKTPAKTTVKTKIGLFFQRLAALVLLTVLGVLLLPVSVNLFMKTFLSSEIIFSSSDSCVCSRNYNASGGIDCYSLINPTLSYLSNYTFFNNRIDYKISGKKVQMASLVCGDRLINLEAEIRQLNKKYPDIKPAVFVWSMDNANFIDIDGNKIYPAASIIKLPVLIQLYKSVEAEQFALNDRMCLTEYYRSSGSGSMQYAQCGKSYSVFDLAKLMIQDSDNTATNMLISKIGSMNNINAALKNWGINNTHIQTWLPDLTGTNYTTAKDIAQILYNIGNDDNEFLNINSQSDIINIMGKVKNVSLIKAGLPEKVEFIHKTGDIGSMLGDAGIVYLPSGRRYIIVILAERPYNHPNGKLFIQDASKIIYNYMSNQN